MKIISNFKDYYDFIQGKYGIDTKVVYERIPETKTDSKWWKSGIYVPGFRNIPDGYYFHMIAFCGTLYAIWYNRGKFYIGDEIESLHSDMIRTDKTTYAGDREYLQYHGKPTTANYIAQCPVALVNRYWGDKDFTVRDKNPKLSDFNFAKVVPPEEAYLKIYNFLIEEPVIKDNRTDVEKVVSHGFDKKTSFRKM